MNTLEELKAENAADDAETEESPQESEEKAEEAGDEKSEEETEETAESEEEETEEAESEAWMQTDEEADDKKFTDNDVAAAKNKLRAKLERKHDSEMEELQEENRRLKSQGSSQDLKEPKRDDFADAEDPETAYQDARADWRYTKRRATEQTEAAASETKQQQESTKKEVNLAVDQHYVRATELAEKSGIKPEMYQSADLTVRQAIDSVFPNSGDMITDSLIASLGEGSEKVFYHLGVNKAKLAEFKNLLTSDKSGIKAASYLGSLRSELIAPNKRKTNAPAPAKNANGDKQTNASERALKKAYDKADQAGDVQARFDARKAAKAEGVDVSTW